MEFDWDADKAASNLAKHGVAFEVVLDLDWAAAIIRTVPGDFGEPRWTAFHRAGDERTVVVFTRRGAIYRIISVRRGHEKEFRHWLE
ncbi:MAG: BrnT family toxin [Hyphomicrobiales bacterium]|nr:MAG: BrnT family toxin [Hyphomicrobiales bacterium]